MEKKSVQAISVIVFSSVLYVAALTNGTQSAEIGQIQNAMRELKRMDNLHFSYEYCQNNEDFETIQFVDTWADLLTGQWVSEHSNTDADGTLLYLRQYFDGQNVYIYNTLSGYWVQDPNGDSTITNLDRLTSIPYRMEDITNLIVTAEDGYQKISFSPTYAYMEKAHMDLLESAKQSYHSYEQMEMTSDDLESARIGIEQYEKTRQEAVSVSYTIDPDGVLCETQYTVTMVQPEIVTDKDGRMTLGKESAFDVVITMQVLTYDEELVPDKIGAYRRDVRGME